MGRPKGAQNKDKPYRDALRLEVAALAAGEVIKHPKGSLRRVAQQHIFRAGEETAAQRELADRLDGKVPQAIVDDAEHDPLTVGVQFIVHGLPAQQLQQVHEQQTLPAPMTIDAVPTP
jgi:hypothetical protein